MPSNVVSDDETKEGGSRVTRSLRKRLNSVDHNDSAGPATPIAATKSLGSISESQSSPPAAGSQRSPPVDSDIISIADSDGASYSTPTMSQTGAAVRRTRARVSSALTVENVSALATGSPARRSTRRTSTSTQELAPAVVATGTPGRRTTRRSSMTSDDGSVVSSQQPASTAGGRQSRRSVAASARAVVAETLVEEADEEAAEELVAVVATPLKKEPAAETATEATITPKSGSGGAKSAVLNISSDSDAPHPVALRRSAEFARDEEQLQQASQESSSSELGGSRLLRVNVKRLSAGVVAEAASPAKRKDAMSPGIFSDEGRASPKSATPQQRKSLAAFRIENLDESVATEPVSISGSPATVRSSPRLSASVAQSPVAASLSAPSTPKRSPRVAQKQQQQQIVESEAESVAAEETDAAVVVVKTELSRSLNASGDEPMEVDESFSVEEVVNSDQSAPVVTQTEANGEEQLAADRSVDMSGASAESASVPTGSPDHPPTPVTTSPALPTAPAARRSALAINNGALNKSVNKSVTFVETPPVAVVASSAAADASAEDVFHDTCSDLPEDQQADADEADAAAAAADEGRSPLVLDAGATPMRKRPNLSLRSSTPIVVATAAAAAAVPQPSALAQVAEPEVHADAEIGASEEQPEKKRPTAVKAVQVNKRHTIHSTREVSASPTSATATNATILLSRSWSQAVHGNASAQIDAARPPITAADSEEVVVIKAPVRRPQLADYDDDDEEDSENQNDQSGSVNSFIAGECEEAPEGAESGDSMDSEERREIEENAIEEAGISIGSKDSDGGDDDDEEDEEMDSFIVSDGDGEGDELLDGTGDDLSDAEAASGDDGVAEKAKGRRNKKTHKAATSAKRNRIDDSESDEAANAAAHDGEEEEEVAAKKAKRSSISRNRIADDDDEELLEDEELRVEDEEDEEVVQGETPVASAANTSSSSCASNGAKDSSDPGHSTSNKDDTEVEQMIGERQTNKLLSKSVVWGHDADRGSRKSRLAATKHNKSVNWAAQSSDDSAIAAPAPFSPFVLKPLSKRQQRKSLNKSGAAAVVANTEQVAKEEETPVEPEDAADSGDVEMSEVPTPKAKAKKQKEEPYVFKAPAYDAIRDRCDIILASVNEARRQDKLTNKKELPDMLVELKRQKKEAKLLEKARRAAAIIEEQKQEAERRQRKAEKKAKKATSEQEAAKSKPVDEAPVPVESVAAKKDNKKKFATEATETSTTLLGAKKSKKTTEYFPLPDSSTVLAGSAFSAYKPLAQAAETEAPAAPSATGKAKKLKVKKEIAVPTSAAEPAKKQKPNSKPVAPSSNSSNEENQSQDDDEQLRRPVSKKEQKKRLKLVNRQLKEAQQLEQQQLAAAASKQRIVDAAPAPAAAPAAKKKRTQREAAIDNSTEHAAPQRKKPKTAKTAAAAEIAPPAATTITTKKLLNILGAPASLAAPAQPKPAAPKDNYKILQIRSQPTANSQPAKKRRLPEIREKPTMPEQPKWTASGKFVVSQVPSRSVDVPVLDGHVAGASSDFVVTTLSKKRKLKMAAASSATTTTASTAWVASSTSSSAAEQAQLALAGYRERAQFGDRVQRETSKQLLQRKQKQRANARV